MTPSYRLLVEYEGGPCRSEAYATPRVVIGRDQGDLLLPDPQISNGHAELIFDGQRLWLRDLRSTNGTWLNGQRIAQVELVAGMSFQLGSHRVTYTGVVGTGRGGTVAVPVAPPIWQKPAHQGPSAGAWQVPGQHHQMPTVVRSSTKARHSVLPIVSGLVMVGMCGLAFIGWHGRARIVSLMGPSIAGETMSTFSPASSSGSGSTQTPEAPASAHFVAKVDAPLVQGEALDAGVSTESKTLPSLEMLFDGSPSGYTLARMVPLNRAFPKKLAVWNPPGWSGFAQERYDDLLQVVAPANGAIVLINTSVNKVNDAKRKVWTQSMDVRKATYGDWISGSIGDAHFPARLSEGEGVLDGEPAKLYAIALQKGAEEYLLIVAIKQSSSDELRGQAIAVAKSVRAG
jgi:hypothetical protein